MAALTITAADMIPGADAVYLPGRTIAGATITQGQVVYVDTSDSDKIKLADANGSALLRVAKGIAATSALTGQPVLVQTGGSLSFGAILTVAHTYILGATAGEINPIADLASGWYLNYIGYAETTSLMRLMILSTGYAKA